MTSSLAHWVTPTVLAAACCLTVPNAEAGTTRFSDSFVFETTNQNIWSAGNSIESGSFNLGAQHVWGWREGRPPVKFGLDAISGGVEHVSMPWPIPSFDIDTRTGAAFSVATSGYAMLGIDTRVKGGQVSVTLPMSTSLEIAGVGNGRYHAGGTVSIDPGANMSVTAPSYRASVGGGLGVEATLSGTGCFIGAGCSSSSSSINFDGYATNILTVDTTSTAAFTAFGLPVPGVPQLGKPYDLRVDASSFYKPTMSPVIGQFTAYKMSDVSGAAFSGNKLSLTASTGLLDVVADVSGMAAVGYGSPIDPLNPSLDLRLGKVSFTSVNGRIGVANDLEMAYSLDPVLMTKLTFDRDVWAPVKEVLTYIPTLVSDPTCGFPDMHPGCIGFGLAMVNEPIYHMVERNVGRSLTFAVRDGVDFRFDGPDGNVVDHEYFLDANFINTGTLVQELALNVDAACAQYSFSLGIGSGRECAFSQQYRPATTVEREVYEYEFDLGGFNTIKIPQFGGVAEVPEPATYALLLTSLATCAAARRRGRTVATRLD